MMQTESLQWEDGFARALARARGYLEPHTPQARAWPVLAAAAAFAVSSMVFAVAAIMAPSVTLSHLPPSAASLPPAIQAKPAAAPSGIEPPLAGAVS